MPGLYDEDILLWSEQQARLLRRLARGERVNGVDWENVAEEIEAVGRSQLHDLADCLDRALAALLLAHALPGHEQRGHWRAEARLALADAADRYAPSMAARLDLDELWTLAVTNVHERLNAHGAEPPDLPGTCPFAIGDLVAPEPDLDALLARLATAAAAGG